MHQPCKNHPASTHKMGTLCVFCVAAERDRLAARVDELEARNEKVRELCEAIRDGEIASSCSGSIAVRCQKRIVDLAAAIHPPAPDADALVDELVQILITPYATNWANREDRAFEIAHQLRAARERGKEN